MPERQANPEKLLDPTANNAFQRLCADLREALLVEAQRTAVGGVITEDDIVLAHKRLSFPTRDSIRFANTQALISNCLAENRIVEWVSYAMATVLFVFGLVMISVGVAFSDTATRVACLVGGSLVELLVLIPFRFTINSRRHNIALRMLGMIVDRVDDPKKLSALLNDTFVTVVLGNPPFNAGKAR